jgi:hypothetical protein
MDHVRFAIVPWKKCKYVQIGKDFFIHFFLAESLSTARNHVKRKIGIENIEPNAAF